MPSLSEAAQAQTLQYYFQGAQPPPLPAIYLALHNAAPGSAGNQSTNETFYAGYSRIAVVPSAGTFLVSQGSPTRAQNLQPLIFPQCNGTLGDTLNFWSIGLAASGPGTLITSGPIGPGLVLGFAADEGSPCTLFVPGLPSGTQVNSSVVLQSFGPGMLLPQGLVDGQLYYVGTVDAVNGLVTLSYGTDNSSPVSATASGSGFLLPVTPLNVAQGFVPVFPPNSLLAFMD